MSPIPDLNEILAAEPAIARDRAEINRENATLSTGPRTEAGKQISSLNALKHGLYSHQVVLPGENLVEFDKLGSQLEAQFKPESPEEHAQVKLMRETTWRLTRVIQLERSLFITTSVEELDRLDPRLANFDEETQRRIAGANAYRANAKVFEQLHRQEVRLSRKLDKLQRDYEVRNTHRDFGRLLQKRTDLLTKAPEPKPTSQSQATVPASGFVPSKTEMAGFVPSDPEIAAPATPPVSKAKGKKLARKAFLKTQAKQRRHHR